MEYGIVYLLTNPVMPGLVKIGMTTREDMDSRMRELYSTGVPVPICLQSEEIWLCQDRESPSYSILTATYKCQPWVLPYSGWTSEIHSWTLPSWGCYSRSYGWDRKRPHRWWLGCKSKGSSPFIELLWNEHEEGWCTIRSFCRFNWVFGSYGRSGIETLGSTR